jgi:hypothetical protein
MTRKGKLIKILEHLLKIEKKEDSFYGFRITVNILINFNT